MDARSLRSDRALTRAWSLRSDRAEHAFGRCVATLFEHLSDVSCFLRKVFRKEESISKKYLSKKRSGNQNGNFYGQRSNFNQSSQQKKPYSNNYRNNKSCRNSFNQKPPLPTQESKNEAMLDKVLQGQQSMTMDFNGKIDSIYTNLNTKFETLSTHVKKLEMQVIQTREAVQRQESLTRGVGDDVMKHHVNAIIDDDFWQVVKQEKLQEGDFEVEISMSFGGSHWCRSTPDFEHRSTDFNQNRLTVSPEH
ncbi:hypothetical protein F2Q70_00003149 [Brassica cretica]|uniref:Uncharacterized protein n=1 Tax=Brassica cretica TaxID=69181 RepID=A0A8S9IWW3_BRACR|nr:hypothetical protein F2Q70_00003149 [Brassica cretica]